MIFVEVCIGSSCHLKGSPEIVEKFNEMISAEHLENDIILSGSFCTGRCNRIGVTITVNDEIYTGITPETFSNFWKDTIIPALKKSNETSV